MVTTLIAQLSGLLAPIANNRVVTDDNPDYLCTDCHPPYRAERITDLLAELPAATVSDMGSVHADTHSFTAREFIVRLNRLPAMEGPAAALRDLIAGWDACMAANSKAAAAYARTRRELAWIALERSGLSAVSRDPVAQVAPGVAPLKQIWWALPSLLRNNDTAFLGGWDWDHALTVALERVAETEKDKTWSELHHVRMSHPLSAAFPQTAAQFEPPGLPVGGDNDTVKANGCYWASSGLNAAYGAVARYVFDVGNWDNCAWVLFHGASGHATRIVLDDAAQLTALGVEAFDYTVPSDDGFETFHAKVALADDQLAYVGSTNMTVFARH